jgi:hypothetical protein
MTALRRWSKRRLGLTVRNIPFCHSRAEPQAKTREPSKRDAQSGWVLGFGSAAPRMTKQGRYNPTTPSSGWAV